MKFSTTGNFEALGSICVFYTKADICIQLTIQTVTKMTGSDVFTFLSCKRTVIYHEVHGKSRFGDLLERDCFRIVTAAEGITDMDIFDTGYSYDGTDGCFFYFDFVQSVKFIKFADLDFFAFVKVMMVQKSKLLVDSNLTVFYFTDTDTSDIFVVVDGADQYLCVSVRITFRCRDIFQNGLKQRSHVFRCICKVKNCMACFCRCIQERAVKLLIRGFQIHEKFQNFINNFFRTCFRTVDFVDADDDVKVKLQCFTENKFGLRHSTLECVYEKNNAIDHFQNTLYLTTEISMSRCVDDVDFDSFVMDSSIFR